MGKKIGKARNGRLNQARRYAKDMLAMLPDGEGTPHNTPIDDAAFWYGLRNLTGLICQCVHEANAYNNALAPDAEGEEVFSIAQPERTGRRPSRKARP
jgi:hypothetical protein